MEEVTKPFKWTRLLLSIFDIALALIIIFFASKLYNTSLGAVTLMYGLVLLTVVTSLRIFQQW